MIDGRAYQFICLRGEGLVASELYRRDDGGRSAWRAARDDGAADTLTRINALLARFDGESAGDAP